MTVSVTEDKWHDNWRGDRVFGEVNSISFNERQETEYTVEMYEDYYRTVYPRILMRCKDYAYGMNVEVNRVSAWKLFGAIADNPEICEIVRDMCNDAIKYREKEKQYA